MNDDTEKRSLWVDIPTSEVPAITCDDDRVGYGKPPRHARFKKGFSGNPRGRPPLEQSPHLGDIFRRAFLKKITIIEEGGRRRRISKLDAGFIHLANLFAQGKITALRETIRLNAIVDNPHVEAPIIESKELKDMTNAEIRAEWRRLCREHEQEEQEQEE